MTKAKAKTNAARAKELPSVQVSSDYNQFSLLDLNRRLKWSHVAKLKSAISKRNLLHAIPITVNEKLQIIDGQHRFTAAKELGVPVYYIVVEGLGIQDAITLNISVETWTNRDFMEYYIAQDNEHYKHAAEFNDQGFFLTNTVGLLAEARAKATHSAMESFREGTFRVLHKEYAWDFLAKIRALERHLGFAPGRDFLIAFDRALKVEDFEFERFAERLEEQPAWISKAGDVIGYLRDMEDLYNKGLQKRIRLF